MIILLKAILLSIAWTLCAVLYCMMFDVEDSPKNILIVLGPTVASLVAILVAIVFAF